MSILFKNYLRLIITLLLFFGINISSVMATDCDYFKEAISYMGDNLINEFEETPDCCDMKYITCNSLNKITAFKINNYTDSNVDLNKFIGKLKNLDYLYSLELINVVSNAKKNLPTELGNLKSLKNLKFNNNRVDYEGSIIPSSLGNLTNLQYLELKDNGFTGSIPKSLGKITKLNILDISKNDLSGTIPYDFKNLSSLRNLYLDNNNNLYGYVPLLSDLKYCNYQETDLCYLPDASCKSVISSCTTEQIKNTNNDNGSPYPNTANYEKAAPKRNNDYSGVGNFNFLFALIFLIISCCLCCRRNKNKQKPQAFSVIHINNPNTPDSSNNTNNVQPIQAISPVAALYYPPTSQTATTNYPPPSQTTTTNYPPPSQTTTTNYPPPSQTTTTNYPPPSPYATPINPNSYPYPTPNISYNNPFLTPSYNNGQMPMTSYGGMSQYGTPNPYYPPVSQVSPAIMPQAGSFDSREITPPQSITSAPVPSMSSYEVPPPPYTQSPSAPDEVGPSSGADNKTSNIEIANDTNKDVDSKKSDEKDIDSKEKSINK